MPVASRMEISLLFRRLEWAAGKRTQEMPAKYLVQPKPRAKPQCQQGACCRREGRVREETLTAQLWTVGCDLGSW